jgi:hypothetical protein
MFEPPRLTEYETEQLLYKLCTVLGFCLPPEDLDRLIKSPPSSAHDFAEAVYHAEGLEVTDLDREMNAMIMEAFHNSSLNRCKLCGITGEIILIERDRSYYWCCCGCGNETEVEQNERTPSD